MTRDNFVKGSLRRLIYDYDYNFIRIRSKWRKRKSFFRQKAIKLKLARTKEYCVEKRLASALSLGSLHSLQHDNINLKKKSRQEEKKCVILLNNSWERKKKFRWTNENDWRRILPFYILLPLLLTLLLLFCIILKIQFWYLISFFPYNTNSNSNSNM